VQQTTAPSSQTIESQSEYDPQVPARIETVDVVDEPLNDAPLVLFVIDQKCEGLVQPVRTVLE
jgi:hypothetical protein